MSVPQADISPTEHFCNCLGHHQDIPGFARGIFCFSTPELCHFEALSLEDVPAKAFVPQQCNPNRREKKEEKLSSRRQANKGDQGTYLEPEKVLCYLNGSKEGCWTNSNWTYGDEVVEQQQQQQQQPQQNDQKITTGSNSGSNRNSGDGRSSDADESQALLLRSSNSSAARRKKCDDSSASRDDPEDGAASPAPYASSAIYRTEVADSQRNRHLLHPGEPANRFPGTKHVLDVALEFPASSGVLNEPGFGIGRKIHQRVSGDGQHNKDSIFEMHRHQNPRHFPTKSSFSMPGLPQNRAASAMNNGHQHQQQLDSDDDSSLSNLFGWTPRSGGHHKYGSNTRAGIPDSVGNRSGGHGHRMTSWTNFLPPPPPMRHNSSLPPLGSSRFESGYGIPRDASRSSQASEPHLRSFYLNKLASTAQFDSNSSPVTQQLTASTAAIVSRCAGTTGNNSADPQQLANFRRRRSPSRPSPTSGASNATTASATSVDDGVVGRLGVALSK
ncbi:unnamed protein product [Notodromas monacha]|uniref:Uncharacterized protein n=1 Tax=Notodromas monacha TaxID=399045 RepID=A0A7R9GJ92_9CRUS|nr:unnamed protein product [Notodromas monacha]CAG0923392.1 unnamed protein product [Notodromas monacha]